MVIIRRITPNFKLCDVGFIVFLYMTKNNTVPFEKQLVSIHKLVTELMDALPVTLPYEKGNISRRSLGVALKSYMRINIFIEPFV